MNIKETIVSQAQAAKTASKKLALLSSKEKNRILLAMAKALDAASEDIIFRNSIDIEAAKNAELSGALIDRLTINETRIKALSASLEKVASLDDPIGTIISEWTPPAGISIEKVRVPLGVIGIIYESRPNVTVDSAGLALKSGNAVILRGGSEAINSNHALAKIISKAAYENGLPEGSIQFVETTDREAVTELIRQDGLIDLIIPRGREEMIEFIRENATVPVLSHGKGLCHTYVDAKASMDMAVNIAFNAKCQRPGVCNAMETLLVHEDIAKKLLPILCKKYAEAGVELRGCPIAVSIVPDIKRAAESDWSTEYQDMILSIKVVSSNEEAIDHINKFGSGHSEAIITEDKITAEKFLKEVDASAVFHNASTRLHDGGVFGFGSEMGISTQKLHARGTMGLNELTSTKFIVHGHGEIRT